MNYQELFARAGIVQYKEVEIEGLGVVRIKKLTAADHLKVERMFLEHAVKNKDGQPIVETIRMASTHVCLGVVDESGKTFLDDDAVQALPKDLVYALYNAISDFNKPQGIDETAKKS